MNTNIDHIKRNGDASFKNLIRRFDNLLTYHLQVTASYTRLYKYLRYSLHQNYANNLLLTLEQNTYTTFRYVTLFSSTNALLLNHIL